MGSGSFWWKYNRRQNQPRIFQNQIYHLHAALWSDVPDYGKNHLKNILNRNSTHYCHLFSLFWSSLQHAEHSCTDHVGRKRGNKAQAWGKVSNYIFNVRVWYGTGWNFYSFGSTDRRKPDSFDVVILLPGIDPNFSSSYLFIEEIKTYSLKFRKRKVAKGFIVTFSKKVEQSF